MQACGTSAHCSCLLYPSLPPYRRSPAAERSWRDAADLHDWPKRYPLITATARKIDGSAILDAEVVWIGSDGAAYSDALHSSANIPGNTFDWQPVFCPSAIKSLTKQLRR
jgi:hypothetical protein